MYNIYYRESKAAKHVTQYRKFKLACRKFTLESDLLCVQILADLFTRVWEIAKFFALFDSGRVENNKCLVLFAYYYYLLKMNYGNWFKFTNNPNTTTVQ